MERLPAAPAGAERARCEGFSRICNAFVSARNGTRQGRHSHSKCSKCSSAPGPAQKQSLSAEGGREASSLPRSLWTVTRSEHGHCVHRSPLTAGYDILRSTISTISQLHHMSHDDNTRGTCEREQNAPPTVHRTPTERHLIDRKTKLLRPASWQALCTLAWHSRQCGGARRLPTQPLKSR